MQNCSDKLKQNRVLNCPHCCDAYFVLCSGVDTLFWIPYFVLKCDNKAAGVPNAGGLLCIAQPARSIATQLLNVDMLTCVCSASRCPLVVPRIQIDTYGRRAFAVVPNVWNAFGNDLCDSDLSIASSGRLLKTHLFQQYYVPRVHYRHFAIMRYIDWHWHWQWPTWNWKKRISDDALMAMSYRKPTKSWGDQSHRS